MEIGVCTGTENDIQNNGKKEQKKLPIPTENFAISLLFFDHAYSRTFQTCSIFLSKNSTNNNFDSQVFWTFSQKNLQVSLEICFLSSHMQKWRTTLCYIIDMKCMFQANKLTNCKSQYEFQVEVLKENDKKMHIWKLVSFHFYRHREDISFDWRKKKLAIFFHWTIEAEHAQKCCSIIICFLRP